MKKNVDPPRLAQQFLRWFCDPDLLPEIEGDLHESFQQWVREDGLKKASLRYWINVLTFFRPYFIAKVTLPSPVNQTAMFKNYFIIALRNLLKQKLYSFINIGGLAVGLACFILILLFVQHELSYDRFHENADQIYRIILRQPGNFYLGNDHFALTPAPLASTLVSEYPEVITATSIKAQYALLGLGEHHFSERGLLADNYFFNIFSFPLLRGEKKTALKEPRSIVLTESLARKIFHDEDPIGQTLLYENQESYTVTGITPDVPANSSIQFTFIAAITSNNSYVSDMAEARWDNNSWSTFFVLADNATAMQLQQKMPALTKKYLSDKGDDWTKSSQYIIQPLRNIHLRSHVNEFGIDNRGNITYVYLFLAIGLLILLLACINYTNLAVARSIRRAREVGIRKIVGAVRRQLLGQFLGESALMASLALVLALGLVQLLLPFFGHLMERPIQLNYSENRLLLPGLLVLIALVGLFSGVYPAFFMASLRPIQVFTGKMSSRNSRFRLQRVLIVGQYAASIALVVCSFIIYQQMQYVQQKDLGYEREHVVTVPVWDEAVRRNYATIRNAWQREPNVVAVTTSENLPANIESSTDINGWEGSNGNEKLTVYKLEGGYNFLNVFGIELAAGRTFSPDNSTDSQNAYLINEKAAHVLGWSTEEAIGKHFRRGNIEHQIIGVVKDFHMHSLHQPIEPLIIGLSTDWFRYISAKVRPENLSETIAYLEQTVQQFSSYPFEYQFLDEHFDALYKKEVRLGETFGFFTIIALLIASLGLFGLAAFTAEQRTKEVGIRKVLGASVQSIVSLLARNFLTMVALSFLLATPIAWYAAHLWLQDFAYRIEVQWWMFALAGVLALLIALLTVSYQSIRAALANPVDSLRNE